MKISMKAVYQYMDIFFNFSPTSYHLHPLEVEHCDSLNLPLSSSSTTSRELISQFTIVDEDDFKWVKK